MDTPITHFKSNFNEVKVKTQMTQLQVCAGGV